MIKCQVCSTGWSPLKSDDVILADCCGYKQQNSCLKSKVSLHANKKINKQQPELNILRKIIWLCGGIFHLNAMFSFHQHTCQTKSQKHKASSSILLSENCLVLSLQSAVLFQQLAVVWHQIHIAFQGLRDHPPIQLQRVWSRLQLHSTQVLLQNGRTEGWKEEGGKWESETKWMKCKSCQG